MAGNKLYQYLSHNLMRPEFLKSRDSGSALMQTASAPGTGTGKSTSKAASSGTCLASRSFLCLAPPPLNLPPSCLSFLSSSPSYYRLALSFSQHSMVVSGRQICWLAQSKYSKSKCSKRQEVEAANVSRPGPGN